MSPLHKAMHHCELGSGRGTHPGIPTLLSGVESALRRARIVDGGVFTPKGRTSDPAGGRP